MKTLKWTVNPQPTGRYRSFEKWPWPDCEYKSDPHKGRSAGYIKAESGEEYQPHKVKTGEHSELIVQVYDWSVPGRKTLTLKKRFKTLAEAKQALEEIVNANPHFRGAEKPFQP